MIDKDLAELYGVPTKRLNEQVKWNTKHFPEDFMFQLTKEEKQSLIENYKHLNTLKYSSNLPFAFTEHGAVMLASVLNSERAIEVNVQIIRIFTRMREITMFLIFIVFSSAAFGEDSSVMLTRVSPHLQLSDSVPKITDSADLNMSRFRMSIFRSNISRKKDHQYFSLHKDTLSLNRCSTLSDSIDVLSKKIGGKKRKLIDKTVELPGMTEVPELPLPDFPAFNTSNVDISLPDIKLESIPSVDFAGSPVLNATIPEDYTIPEPSLPSLDKLPKVDNLNEVSDKVSSYQNEAQEIKENLGTLKDSQSLEKSLSETEIMEDVKEQITEADRLKRYSDPEVAREEAVNKAKEEVVNHFAGHEEELKAAMQKLSNLKSKFRDTEGVLDLFAKRQRPLKGKPFIERFIPGLSFQFQKQESFWLDVAPQVGFIVSRRFSTGIAWNERLAYDFDRNIWDRKNHIYGIRNFVNFKLKENLFVRAEVEAMNAPLRVSPVNVEIIGRGWVWSYFGGIKKDFQFSKTLKANVQMLYNLYDPEKDSPYTNRFNVRLGLELPLKRDKPIEVN